MGRPIGKNTKNKKIYQRFAKKTKIKRSRKKKRFNPIIIPIGEKDEKK